MADIASHWYRGSRWLWWLWPLSLLFCLLVLVRRTLYRWGLFRQQHFSVPVIVVGNITVGGSGKTPLVAYLVSLLRKHGYQPGIVSRGYGGKTTDWPQTVTPESLPSEIGDEAVLLARRCNCPVVVGPDRVAAVNRLLESNEVNIVLSDDGMQNYRMGRTIEIAVLDGERRLGNNLCLPAGPLREPPGRLHEVDFVVSNGRAREGEWLMQLIPGQAQRLDGTQRIPLSELSGKPLHAVAGIGNPQRFFNTLRQAGLQPQEHPYGDHYPFAEAELNFVEGERVIMTEKDAVKYKAYADERHWFLPVEAQLDDDFARQLLAQLERDRG